LALKVVALSGGVGGAKLADGLASAMPQEDLTVIVNTADDFDHLGLRICPDLDTVLYNLAGLADAKRGWGRADETWHFLEEMERLAGPTWFRIGDRDLAIHVERTRRLNAGEPLSEVTEHLRRALEVQVRLLPMTDERVETWVHTENETLSFQEYFVARRYEPVVRAFRFQGVEKAEPAPGVLQAIGEAGIVIMCPSNPIVSLDPILAIPGMREAVRERRAIGISPILGQQAVKGPAAKILSELGIEPSALSVAKHYKDLLLGWMIDNQDADLVEPIKALGIEVRATDIMMADRDDRRRLALEVLQFARELLEMEAGT
jgi:LPPG:FO 2-phospho-L-lactate transferase